MVMTKTMEITEKDLKYEIPKSQVRVLAKRDKLYKHIELIHSSSVIEKAMAEYISTFRFYLQVEIDKKLRDATSYTASISDIYLKMRELKIALIDADITGIEELIKIIINNDLLSKYSEFDNIYRLLYIAVEDCYII